MGTKLVFIYYEKQYMIHECPMERSNLHIIPCKNNDSHRRILTMQIICNLVETTFYIPSEILLFNDIVSFLKKYKRKPSKMLNSQSM